MARLSAIGMAYRRFSLDRPDFFRLIFGQLDAAYKPGEEQVGHGCAMLEMTGMQIAKTA